MSSRRRRDLVSVVLSGLSVVMLVYHLLYTQMLLQEPEGHLITHLGFALVIVSLSFVKRRRHVAIALLALGLSVLVTLYLMILLEEILSFRTAIPATTDLVIGSLVITVTLMVTYLVYGKVLATVALVSIGYVVLGRYLPAPFTVPPVPLERILMWLSVTLGTDEGIYGSILGISANYLFHFIVFGALLHILGGTRFIINLGRWIGAKMKSGPAAVALLGSSLLGTVTGSTVANITITGSFTIPLMKKSGYTPEQAGAIETVSSNGGQIMPPVMGATAFVMAGFTGIPYVEIAKAAIGPALLYYFCILVYVELTARKLRIRPVVGSVKGRDLLFDAPTFFVPVGILVFLLVKGFTLPYVGFWSIIGLLCTSTVTWFKKERRPKLAEIISGITDGVRSGSEIAIVCAIIGVVATVIKVSGLGIKLPLFIQEISHGYLLIALLITMISSILLGMGVPTTAAYLLVAIGAVPALRAMGVPVLQAHFFCLLFAVFSHITPPVAIGALVASQIAGAAYVPTTLEAMKAAFIAFLLPFLVVYVPTVLMQTQVSAVAIVTTFGAILLAVFSLQSAISSYLRSELNLLARLIFLLSGIAFFISVFSNCRAYLAFGLILLVAAAAYCAMGMKTR